MFDYRNFSVGRKGEFKVQPQDKVGIGGTIVGGALIILSCFFVGHPARHKQAPKEMVGGTPALPDEACTSGEMSYN
jgi:hypothetical protein